MTTKKLTSIIIEDIIAEIPIQMGGDEQGIREEMSALIYGHVECYRQQMIDKIREELNGLDGAIKFLRNYGGADGIDVEAVMKSLLNENKE